MTIGLPLVSRSNPGGAAFANCILGVALAKLRKRDSTCRVSRLSLTTPASGMKALAQIGAWHNSLDRMPAVILVSPLLNYFNYFYRLLVRGIFDHYALSCTVTFGNSTFRCGDYSR